MKLLLPISFNGLFNGQKPLEFTFIYDVSFLIIGIFNCFPLDHYVVYIYSALTEAPMFLEENIHLQAVRPES